MTKNSKIRKTHNFDIFYFTYFAIIKEKKTEI